MDLMMVICQNAFMESTCGALQGNMPVNIIMSIIDLIVVVLVSMVFTRLFHLVQGDY